MSDNTEMRNRKIVHNMQLLEVSKNKKGRDKGIDKNEPK